MNKSGGPERARQTADSCFELVGSHHRVCTSCSGGTSFMYPKVSLLTVVSGIHPSQTAELHLRGKTPPQKPCWLALIGAMHVHVCLLLSPLSPLSPSCLHCVLCLPCPSSLPCLLSVVSYCLSSASLCCLPSLSFLFLVSPIS